MPEPMEDAADRAAEGAEKLTGGLFSGIKPTEPESDSGSWGDRVCIGQLIVMVDSGLSALFGLIGFFGLFAWLGFGMFGVISLIFHIINLAIMAFIFYTSFEVKSKKRRSFAILQVVLAAGLFVIQIIQAIILSAMVSSITGGFVVGYGGIGSAVLSVFWYAPIVLGAILTMANPGLTFQKLFGGSTTTTTPGTPSAPAPPPPTAKPGIPSAYIYVNKDGQNLGPFDRATFDIKLAAGEFSTEDLVYATNKEWVKIKEVI